MHSTLNQQLTCCNCLAQSYFPDYVDRALLLPAYWSDCEVRLGQDWARARAVWEASIKTPLGRSDAVAFYVALSPA